MKKPQKEDLIHLDNYMNRFLFFSRFQNPQKLPIIWEKHKIHMYKMFEQCPEPV